jgi:hypothetical protein
MAFTNLIPYTSNVEHVTYSIVLNPDIAFPIHFNH